MAAIMKLFAVCCPWVKSSGHSSEQQGPVGSSSRTRAPNKSSLHPSISRSSRNGQRADSAVDTLSIPLRRGSSSTTTERLRGHRPPSTTFQLENAQSDGDADRFAHRRSLYATTHGSESRLTISGGTTPTSEEAPSLGEDIIEDATSGSMEPVGPLLPDASSKYAGRKCLVVDLDETLVHSSFKYLGDADFVIPVEIDGVIHDVFVIKRPGVDEFLKRVSALFEVVVFTASVAKYGNPLLDHLDNRGLVHYRLFRESCSNFEGNYVKNLSILGRPLSNIIIVDNSPASYVLQPANAIPVSSWFSDMHDNELLEMLPFLEDLAKPAVPDVCQVLDTEVPDS